MAREYQWAEAVDHGDYNTLIRKLREELGCKGKTWAEVLGP